MQDDPVRKKIRDLLWRRGLNMREASLAIGRNVSYMHGFLERGTPKVLSHRDARKLARVLACKAEDLQHAERPRRRARSAPTPKDAAPAQSPVPLTAIPEIEIEAPPGPGSPADVSVSERARWYLPEGMIRYEGGAAPGAVRVLRVRGVSMEPELTEGDRLLIDTSRQVAAGGEMFALWDGAALLVKRVEYVNEPDEEPMLRLKSANPDYGDYTVPARKMHAVGKVLWAITRV